MDIVRITENNTVYSTKELDINDNPNIAHKLFEMLNFIVQETITRPREIENLFEDNIPQGTKKAIEKRDKDKDFIS